MKVLVFSVGDKDYGADITKVREVIRLRKVTPVPDVPDFIEGVISFRGKILPLINLGKRFGGSVETSRANRIIIVKVQDHWTGMLVDKVCDVTTFKPEEIVSPDEMFKNAHYLRGVAKWVEKMVLIVDLAELLKSEDTASLQKVQDRVELRKKTE
ncbi:MAG: chemotaxis protein CheW [Candidatus Omnitrophota bacterium]